MRLTALILLTQRSTGSGCIWNFLSSIYSAFDGLSAEGGPVNYSVIHDTDGNIFYLPARIELEGNPLGQMMDPLEVEHSLRPENLIWARLIVGAVRDGTLLEDEEWLSRISNFRESSVEEVEDRIARNFEVFGVSGEELYRMAEEAILVYQIDKAWVEGPGNNIHGRFTDLCNIIRMLSAPNNSTAIPLIEKKVNTVLERLRRNHYEGPIVI